MTLFSASVNFLNLLARNRVGFVGFLGLVAFIVLTFAGPLIVPLDDETHITERFKPPSAQHWLGTDNQGRDTFSRIVHGGREILTIAFTAGLITTAIAVTFGSLAALVGGWFGSMVMSVADIILTVPRFPVLAVIAAIVKLDNPLLLSVLIGVLSWPTPLRAIRAQVLSLRERDYVEAARALDLGTRHILFREIMPNMMSYVLINLIFAMTSAVYELVGLIILGLAPLSGLNWAITIFFANNAGSIYQKDAIYYILSPVLAIALFQLSLVSLSRSLEEIFNPRLRSGV
jgi:peptide/nickel transport system permease protein